VQLQDGRCLGYLFQLLASKGSHQVKLELSIKTTYLPKWGAWEGIRELIQNGRDAEVQFNAPLKITLSNQTLRIENEGAVLPKEALLFGHTTKEGRTDQIGAFGEGLKLGVLSLVRAGRPVTIRSGTEVWRPTIARSDKFDCDVLVFDIQGGREDKKRVRVEVGGVTEVEWRELAARFLFLQKPARSEHASTIYGDLLLAEKYKGRLYVKGIWVCNDAKLDYGYDFKNVELDRDRNMIRGFDQGWAQGSIWREAVAARPDLFESFVDALSVSQEKKDLAEFSTQVYYLEPAIAEKVAANFHKQFGETAFPVSSTGESIEVEHLGRRGVVVPQALRLIVERRTGDLKALREQLGNEVAKRYAVSELTLSERANLEWALVLTEADTTDFVVDVVDFKSPTWAGLYTTELKKIDLSRKVLQDRYETLATLIHERAHAGGCDGSAEHVANLEYLWKCVVQKLTALKQ